MTRKIPFLIALTGESRLALSGASELELTRFPFRVGRESRSPAEIGIVLQKERRKKSVAPNNDLYIWDTGPLLNVSREHFQIERSDSGDFFVRDRGSTCGTLVGNIRLGMGGPESCTLSNDNTIVIGTPQSPFVFRFELREITRTRPDSDRVEPTSALNAAELAWSLKSEKRRGR